MNLKYLLERLLHQPPSYIFGRFLTIRRCYSLYKRISSARSGKFGDIQRKTIFDNLDMRNAVKDLRKNAVALGFNLPNNVVKDIREFAANAELKADNVPYRFFYKDICKGKLPDDTVVAIGYAVAPEESISVSKVLNDPSLRQTVENYLGYKPSNYEVRLYYSFVADLTDQERRNRNQTIDYHFDVHAFNFCYAHFYITETDKNSGAHALIQSSHKQKPFKYLLGSARRSDDEISKYYDQNKFLLIEGKSGTGFLEDTSCYHKAFAPISKDRLLLQIRFF
jgi:hypothetical protein